MATNTTLLRRIVRSLDRPFGRAVLQAYATRHARRASGRDVRVVYDQCWLHQIDGIYWADSSQFTYNRLITPKWLRYADNREAWGRDFWFHVYEPQSGDVIVDIGAGVGTDLPLFSECVGSSGKVIAIEAHPTTFAMMKQAVRRNDLTNVTCVQRAITDRAGTVEITDDEQHVSNAIAVTSQSSTATISVEGDTLEAICATVAVDRIDLLKMNIEGAEQFAIKGMKDVLKRTRVVSIACHDFRADRGDGEQFRTRAIITQFLSELGFAVTTRDDDERSYVRDHVHATNPLFLSNNQQE